MEVYTLGRRNKPGAFFQKVRPDKVDGQQAIRTTFYKEKLEQIVKGQFELDCPDSWNRDYLLDNLLFDGYILISDTQAGIIPLRSSLTEYNYTNFPTKALVSVPILGDFERYLGVDSELIYLTWSHHRGFYNFRELIRIYAEELATCDVARNVNTLNSKMAYVAEAATKAQAQMLKNLFDKISNGEPLVVYKKDTVNQVSMQLLTNNLKQNFIATDITDVKRSIINEFLTYIGINNANTDKKERLITNEVEANNYELAVNIAHMQDTIQRCVDRTHNLYTALDFDMRFRYDPTRMEMMISDTVGTDRNVEYPES